MPREKEKRIAALVRTRRFSFPFGRTRLLGSRGNLGVPAVRRVDPRGGALRAVEVPGVREVAVERLDIEAELLGRSQVRGLVNLHYANVGGVHVAAERLSVFVVLAKGRLAVGHLGHYRGVFPVLANLGFDLFARRKILSLIGDDGSRGRGGRGLGDETKRVGRGRGKEREANR